MAGVYVHIPFCKRKCHYCDFYRTVKLQDKEDIIKCITEEAEIRKDYLKEEIIDTVYFGGGTPSVLSIGEINEIYYAVKKTQNISPDVEFTIEVNPDDLSREFLYNLRQKTNVNRLSIGIQSFNDVDLKLMNRRHNAKKAEEAINDSLNAGFNNISIDLIYGIPEMTVESWQKNLEKAFSFDIKHLSAYHLTYEPGTEFFKRLNKNILKKTTEEESLQQFNILIDFAEKNNFIHYEISNFSKEGFYSRHNSSYWLQKKYLGLGPSSHSYNLKSRHWNVSDNNEYIKKIREGKQFFDGEDLSLKTRYNEYILTRLRTMWGLKISDIDKYFGSYYFEYFKKMAEPFLKENLIEITNGEIKLKKEGIFISDYIISGLMAE